MKKVLKFLFGTIGYIVLKKPKIVEASPVIVYDYADISEESKRIYQACLPYTMISLERTDAIVASIEYLCKNNIPGDIVECGVWRGGAMYAAAQALVARKCLNRKIFLFDMFDVQGIFSTTNETEHDTNFLGNSVAQAISTGLYKREDYLYQIEDVRSLLKSTGYPEENIVFKVGRVEDTLPDDEVKQVALLRLDTDWYESTIHELNHLYPKLVKDGVLLIDDYGHWVGCRKAVDEYISKNNLKMFLHRTDYTGRSVIKN